MIKIINESRYLDVYGGDLEKGDILSSGHKLLKRINRNIHTTTFNCLNPRTKNEERITFDNKELYKIYCKPGDD